MLVAVQSFGSIWTARCARTFTDAELARRGADVNTTGVLAGDVCGTAQHPATSGG
jgi:hypothetical protein